MNVQYDLTAEVVGPFFRPFDRIKSILRSNDWRTGFLIGFGVPVFAVIYASLYAAAMSYLTPLQFLAVKLALLLF